MGLIKSVADATSRVLADQWKEFFYCESIESEVLVRKGQKRTTSRSSNRKGEDNIISNGSIIAVADGQCMIIVDNGKVTELCAEPGEFTYDTSTESSIFDGGRLGDNIKETFKNIGVRFTFGGSPGKDQRIYYFNTKEILGNKYGTPSPVPFRVVDTNIGLDIDIAIRCFGEYSYKIIDPMLFYTNVCGNITEDYIKSEIDGMLKSELLTALQPAFAKISDRGVRYSALPGHTLELADALNEVLSKKWTELRGLKISSFGVSSVKASEEDEEMIKELQRTAVMRNPNMAAATLVGAQADAMRNASANESGMGAMMGFMGMNMAQNTGGMNASDLFAMGQAQQPYIQQPTQVQQVGQPQQVAYTQGVQSQSIQPQGTTSENIFPQNTWVCQCGHTSNTGKFCLECGSPKPVAIEGWTCSCGAVNKGKFCPECGSKKPIGAPLYACDKCGWVPNDPKNPPKFCPECGDVFDEEDIK